MAKVTLTITYAELLQLASQKYGVAFGDIHVVEEYETYAPEISTVPNFLEDMVREQLQEGKKITAIFKVMKETGWSLDNSKKYVETFKI
jgi:ribosomal protein L7/L12